MKTYEQFIAEATAVAKAKFKKQFSAIRHSDAFTDAEYKKGNIQNWHLTGHNAGTSNGSTKAIEAVKEKVFGKRRKGTSDLLWMHHHHGLITHPARGDVTHSDVQNVFGDRPRKGIKIDKKIQKKVKEGGISGVVGRGRIEHHEGGGGIISYHHGGGMPKEAVLRTISRAYPKYKIHDGHGNLLEATAVAKKKKPTSKEKAEFARKFHKVADSTNFSPWKLTGHNPGVKHGTSKAVEAMKEKVFGKRRKGTSDLLFLHLKHGIITHPAVGDITHSDVMAHDAPGLGIRSTQRKGVKIDKKIQAKVKEGGIGAIIGQGRIEHHEGGGGVISFSPKSAAVRTIARAYPKYKIHDGHGNLLENWSYAHNFHEMPENEKKKYVYHVTTAARAAKIVKGGLKPRSPKGRTNYPDAKEHTQGHAFVTNHHGVRYWVDQTAHAVNRRKREVDERDYENIHVLKFPIANLKKSTRRKLRTDELGTKDARKHDDDPLIDPSSHEASTALKIRKKIHEDATPNNRRSDRGI